MLISTSRKPSQRTRSFCNSLSRALNFPYVNRGKMSLRELAIKTMDMEENSTILIYEKHGNPNELIFLNSEVKKILSLDISTSLNKDRLKIDPFELKFVSDFPELDIIGEIFNLKKVDKSDYNYVKIEKINNSDNIAVINFVDENNEKTDLKIFIKGYNIF